MIFNLTNCNIIILFVPFARKSVNTRGLRNFLPFYHSLFTLFHYILDIFPPSELIDYFCRIPYIPAYLFWPFDHTNKYYEYECLLIIDRVQSSTNHTYFVFVLFCCVLCFQLLCSLSRIWFGEMSNCNVPTFFRNAE